MKRVTSLVSLELFVLSFLVSSTSNICGAEIKWAKSFDEAVRIAKQKKMPLMIDVYTDWCGWCKRLDKDVYTNKDVLVLSEKFVCFKLNPETDKEHGALFKVEGFPTIIFTDPDRKELLRIDGYLPPKEFAEQMKKALESFGGK